MPNMNHEIKPQADYLFEVSWEAANKVGGIYTVLQTKARRMLEYYSENYFLIGPYFIDRVKGEFEEKAPPEEIKKVFDELEKRGIRGHFGSWLIEGEPKIILLDFVNFLKETDQIKTELWLDYKIDSLAASSDFNEPVVFSKAAGMLIEKLAGEFKNKKIVAHFHEWLAGAGLLHLAKNRRNYPFLKTVFTTHATVLGRSLANLNADIYAELKNIAPDSEAARLNVQAKHLLEKAAAKNADIFTTISEITAIEAEKILGRKPDILLPNGLDMEKYPSFEDVSIKHRLQRDRIREFILYYFFPYYSFDVKNTLFYFTAARYEFHNKGIDLFIRALGALNEKLKEEKSGKTIIAFFWIPSGIRGIKPEILENREIFRDVKDELMEAEGKIEENILYSLFEGHKLSEEELFEKSFIVDMKKKLLKLRKKGLPSPSTHELADPNDAILKSFEENALLNREEDRVKVIFYPIYLTGNDGLLNLTYQEGLQGCHLGVFPSFYEPWGYTPLETAALGVASVTSDLAGLGRFFMPDIEQKKYPGIFAVKRFGRSDDEAARDLAGILHSYSRLTREERIENKIATRKLAGRADWKVLITEYVSAHNLALEK